MKLLFALLALTPLVYCARLTREEMIVIDAMTKREKRALFPFDAQAFWNSVKKTICAAGDSDFVKVNCPSLCPAAVAAAHPQVSLAAILCPTFCDVNCRPTTKQLGYLRINRRPISIKRSNVRNEGTAPESRI